MLGLQPEERGHALALLAREMFTQSASAAERSAPVRNFIAAMSMSGKDKEIAGRLAARHHRRAADRRSLARRLELPDADLFAALISNRSALLVCAGAMAADPSMRALLERDRGLLRWIVRTAPAAFWLARAASRLENDRVIVPGGAGR